MFNLIVMVDLIAFSFHRQPQAVPLPGPPQPRPPPRRHTALRRPPAGHHGCSPHQAFRRAGRPPTTAAGAPGTAPALGGGGANPGEEKARPAPAGAATCGDYNSQNAPGRRALPTPLRAACAPCRVKGDPAVTSSARCRPGMRVAIGRHPPRFPACWGAGSGNGGAGAAGRAAPRGEYLAEPPPHPAGRRAAGPRPGRELKRD